MLNDLKRTVCRANIKIHQAQLAASSWGSVSGFDMSMGLFVVKPAGVDESDLQPEQMLVMSMDGQKVEGRLSVPWDVAAHQAIYMINPMVIGSIVHLQSEYVTVYAQAGMPIPVYGTIHAETFAGAIPVTRAPSADEQNEPLAALFGKLAAETVTDYEQIPAVLIRRHGAFVWGQNPQRAVRNAIQLEKVAKIAYFTNSLAQNTPPMEPEIIQKCVEEIKL